MTIGIMEVMLLDAKGLADTDFLGKIDPYVLIQYRRQEQESSVARGQGGTPAWNEKFSFKVEYPNADDQYKLILKIMDKDTFSADDFLGQATIYLKDLLALGVENGIAELHPRKYSVVRADQSYRGEIRVGISFTPRVREETDEEEFGGWKQSHYQLSLTVCRVSQYVDCVHESIYVVLFDVCSIINQFELKAAKTGAELGPNFCVQW